MRSLCWYILRWLWCPVQHIHSCKLEDTFNQIYSITNYKEAVKDDNNVFCTAHQASRHFPAKLSLFMTGLFEYLTPLLIYISWHSVSINHHWYESEVTILNVFNNDQWDFFPKTLLFVGNPWQSSIELKPIRFLPISFSLVEVECGSVLLGWRDALSFTLFMLVLAS